MSTVWGKVDSGVATSTLNDSAVNRDTARETRLSPTNSREDVYREFHRRDKPEWPDSPHVSGLLEGIIAALPKERSPYVAQCPRCGYKCQSAAPSRRVTCRVCQMQFRAVPSVEDFQKGKK